MAAKRILVADDNAVLRRLLATILKLRGYEVISVADGDEALAVLRDPSIEVALVLADYYMPRMDGIALLRHVKREAPDVPVVVLTISEDAFKMDEAQALGAVSYLVKPVDPSALMRVIDEIFNKADEVSSKDGELVNEGEPRA